MWPISPIAPISVPRERQPMPIKIVNITHVMQNSVPEASDGAMKNVWLCMTEVNKDIFFYIFERFEQFIYLHEHTMLHVKVYTICKGKIIVILCCHVIFS